MILRPYQQDCLHHIETQMQFDKNIMVKLPTSAGKTEIFISLARGFNGRVLVLLNRVMLLEQTRRRFLADGQACGAVCGSLGVNDFSQKVTIATIQTIARASCNEYDLIIIDEAHRAIGEQYEKFLAGFNHNIVRFTATPFTSNGYLYGPEMDIKDLTFEMSLNELTDMGYITPISFKSTKESFDTSELNISMGDYNFTELEKLVGDEKKIRLQIDDALPRLMGRKKIVWACVGIDHAKKVTVELLNKGQLVSIVHSDQSYEERKINIDQFEKEDTRHLVNISIVAEGYDFAPIDAIVLMRPTKSPVLLVQIVGRGLRLAQDKKDCLVLDYGNVVETLGHPNNPKIKKKYEREKQEKMIKLICPQCCEMFFSLKEICLKCSYVFEVKKQKEFTKNLTREAYLAEDQEKLLEITGWEINHNYVSKKGNPCIHVVYKNGFLPVHTEYLSKTGPGLWASNKFLAETKNGTVMPKKLLVKKDFDSKWWRIVKREYF